jgi:hypothetical protein
MKQVRIKNIGYEFCPAAQKRSLPNWLPTTFRALRSAGRIYSSRPEQKLNKGIKLRTYCVDELHWVEPEPKLIVVLKLGSTPSAPLMQSLLLAVVLSKYF